MSDDLVSNLLFAMNEAALLRAALREIEVFSDNCINAEHYTGADALCDLREIRHVIKRATPPTPGAS